MVSVPCGLFPSGCVGDGTGTAEESPPLGRSTRSVSYAASGARAVSVPVPGGGGTCCEGESGSGIVASTRSAAAEGVESRSAPLRAGSWRGAVAGAEDAGTGVPEAGGTGAPP